MIFLYLTKKPFVAEKIEIEEVLYLVGREVNKHHVQSINNKVFS